MRARYVLFSMLLIVLAGCTALSGSTGDQVPVAAGSGETEPRVEVVHNVTPDRVLKLRRFEFGEPNVTVEKGTVVKFTNNYFTHTLTLASGDLDVYLDPNENVTLRFNEDGYYQFYCRFHSTGPDVGMTTAFNVTHNHTHRHNHSHRVTD